MGANNNIRNPANDQPDMIHPTTDKASLTDGAYYLLKAPTYNECGYVIAIYDGTDTDGEPCFRDEMLNMQISPSVIEGWAELE